MSSPAIDRQAAINCLRRTLAMMQAEHYAATEMPEAPIGMVLLITAGRPRVIKQIGPEYVYVTQDEDGSWFAHKAMPAFMCEPGWWSVDHLFIGKGTPNPDWRESLFTLRDPPQPEPQQEDRDGL